MMDYTEYKAGLAKLEAELYFFDGDDEDLLDLLLGLEEFEALYMGEVSA